MARFVFIATAFMQTLYSKIFIATIIVIIIITVMRRSFLPGVTTLSRDLCRRPILGASNHNYLFIFIAWNLSLLE